MAWRFFGRSYTSEIGVSEVICGEGSVGVTKYYDTYVFGIKTGSGSETTCFGLVAPGSGPSGEEIVSPRFIIPVSFNSVMDVEKLEQRSFTVEKIEGGTGGFRWSCKNGDSTGISPTRSAARSDGRDACGVGKFNIEEIRLDAISIEVGISAVN